MLGELRDSKRLAWSKQTMLVLTTFDIERYFDADDKGLGLCRPQAVKYSRPHQGLSHDAFKQRLCSSRGSPARSRVGTGGNISKPTCERQTPRRD